MDLPLGAPARREITGSKEPGSAIPARCAQTDARHPVLRHQLLTGGFVCPLHVGAEGRAQSYAQVYPGIWAFMVEESPTRRRQGSL